MEENLKDTLIKEYGNNPKVKELVKKLLPENPEFNGLILSQSIVEFIEKLDNMEIIEILEKYPVIVELATNDLYEKTKDSKEFERIEFEVQTALTPYLESMVNICEIMKNNGIRLV